MALLDWMGNENARHIGCSIFHNYDRCILGLFNDVFSTAYAVYLRMVEWFVCYEYERL
jgi:hypothetical protein